MTETCQDCSRCTGQPSLARGLGRSESEVQRLAERCPSCRHRLNRYAHGPARSVLGDQADHSIQLMEARRQWTVL